MTGQELFEIALDLCGLRENDSEIPNDTEDLKQRALALINIVIAENASIDCGIRRTEHRIAQINAMSDAIDCCDTITSTVLPYGLARLMMLGEDDAFAADLNKLYSEARNAAIRIGYAKRLPITEVYQ